MDKNMVVERIAKEKLIPVIKIDDTKYAIPLMEALIKGGITIAEVTMRTSCGAEAMKLIKEAFPYAVVGAGTVLNAKSARKVLDMGAEFIVSPGFDEGIAKLCIEHDVPYIGGCLTPTELMRAREMGLFTVKFFPSESFGGVKTIKALSAAFPDMSFIPTGGISENNLADYLAFPKITACGGSWMVKENLIVNEKYEEITLLSRKAREIIDGGKL